MTLKELAIGKSAVIRTVGASGALRQHFLDMGMIPGAEVTVVKFAPMGDPIRDLEKKESIILKKMLIRYRMEQCLLMPW